MNKTLIALAVSTAAIASGANAAVIFNQDGTSLEMGGRAEARLSFKDSKAQDASRVRLNFLGTTQITDSLYGVGFYEGEFVTNPTTVEDVNGNEKTFDSLDNRYVYAGIGGDFGLVTYGKNDGALGVITDFTDIMAYAGNSAAYKLAVADRADNMLTYQGQFNNLGLKASYHFADRTDKKNGHFGDDSQDGYSLSTVYAVGDTGMKVGAGYAEQDRADEYMLAASYSINNLYLGTTFTDGNVALADDENKTFDYRGYELAAAYTLGQTVFTTTYNNAQIDSTDSANNLAFDATYFFQPNFRAYVSYNFNLIDENDMYIATGDVQAASRATAAQAEDELALGLRYDF